MSRPSIWIVNQFAGSPESGWGERHFYLSKPAVDKGERIVIISSGNNHMFNHDLKLNGLFTHKEYEGVEFLWVWIPPYNPKNITRFFSMFFFSFALLFLPFKLRKIGKPKQVVLSSMSIFPVPSILFLKRVLNIKRIVFEVRDLWPLTPIHLMGVSKKNPLIILIGWLEKLAYKKSDAIICLFNEAKPYINAISKSPEKFHWIPNGVARDFLHFKKPTLKIELPKFKQEKPIVCYTGTLGFANAMDEFFKFLADPELEELSKLFNFLIVGDGYLKPKYVEVVSKCENVIFTGKLPKKAIPQIIQQSTICFIAWHKSDLYSYGVSANKYFDYMAAGKPILSAQEGIVDPVVKSGCGVVVKNNKKEIAHGFEQLFKMDKSNLNDMGELGLKYVLNNHIYDDLSEKFFKIVKG